MRNTQGIDTPPSSSPSIKPSLDWPLFLKFLLPSLAGVLLFLTPIAQGNQVTIGMSLVSDFIKQLAGDYLLPFIVLVTTLSAALSLGIKLAAPAISSTRSGSRLLALFHVSWLWTLVRIAGAIFAVMTYYESGLDWVYDRNTGGVMLLDLAPTIFILLFVASLLLPLLTDFGLMEFIGSIFSKPFKAIFGLPGRSAIDASASWMAASSVGVLITAQQYEKGYYSKREAAVIATNFSVVSVVFCLVIAELLNIDHMFISFYLTICLTGLIAALIMPRIPPLSRLADSYEETVGKQIEEEFSTDLPAWKEGIRQSMLKAKSAPGPIRLVKEGTLNVLDIWFGLFPAVMAIGTVSLMLTEYTPIFTYLSSPFVPLLELLGLPEARQAAPAMLVGFADMFLPAILGASIESELTRFVIGGIAVSQLVYMSEIGVLILRSKIPLGFFSLFAIFLLRTFIALPIFATSGHLLIQ